MDMRSSTEEVKKGRDNSTGNGGRVRHLLRSRSESSDGQRTRAS